MALVLQAGTTMPMIPETKNRFTHMGRSLAGRMFVMLVLEPGVIGPGLGMPVRQPNRIGPDHPLDGLGDPFWLGHPWGRAPQHEGLIPVTDVPDMVRDILVRQEIRSGEAEPAPQQLQVLRR